MLSDDSLTKLSWGVCLGQVVTRGTSYSSILQAFPFLHFFLDFSISFFSLVFRQVLFKLYVAVVPIKVVFPRSFLWFHILFVVWWIGYDGNDDFFAFLATSCLNSFPCNAPRGIMDANFPLSHHSFPYFIIFK